MPLIGILESLQFVHACWALIAMSLVLGLVAFYSPRAFERLCKKGQIWVNTPLRLKGLDDYVVDTDALATSHSRLTGLIFIFMALALAFASGIL